MEPIDIRSSLGGLLVTTNGSTSPSDDLLRQLCYKHSSVYDILFDIDNIEISRLSTIVMRGL